MSEPQDAGKYQVDIDGTVQGPVIGDNATVHQHFYGSSASPEDKAPSSPAKPQHVWNIPYRRNDYFTGREEILVELHTRFKANNATALSQRHAMSGLGGIGKTQTAVEYAYRYHEEYQAVLWAHAESHEALTSSFVEIARLLDLPQKDEQDQTITVQAVKRWLQDNEGWLLIFDNVDEPAIVREFLPTKCEGHMLLTTRAQALGGLAQRIEVDTFTPELGALFLLRRATLIDANSGLEQATSEDREVAMQISEELGGLALALDQAGAYIEESQCSLSDYQSLYRTRRAEVLKERGGLTGEHPESVATTWALSFQRVEEKNAAAADLLRLCAFLAPDAIPEEIVIKGAEHLGPTLQTAVSDPMALNKAIAALGAYSLIRRDPTERTLSVHRLVQAVLRDAMGEQEQTQWHERIMLALDTLFPYFGPSVRQRCERLTLHVLACAAVLPQMEHPVLASILAKAADYLQECAQYREAESLYQQAFQIYEKVHGPGHPLVAYPLNNLAILYSKQGRYAEAEPLLQRTLQIHEKAQGEQEHPLEAYPLNNLADLYREQGRYAEAEPLYQRTIQIWITVKGRGYSNAAFPLNGLADLRREQGRYIEAESLYQQAWQICEKARGPEHPNIAVALNGLANLYREQGKYAEAEPLYQRALHIREQQLGPEHPEIAETMHGLAQLREKQGNSEEARYWFTRALTIRDKVLGSQHPKTIETRKYFITLLRTIGRDEEAKQIEEKQ